MQTINYQDFSDKLSTVIEMINNDQEPICLELPNSLRAIILSEQDYNSMMETLYLLSNPINAEKLLTAINRSNSEAVSWEQIKEELFKAGKQLNTDKIQQKPHPDLAGQVQIKGEIFDSIPEQDWEILKG